MTGRASNDVYQLLSTLHTQLEHQDNRTLRWRDDIEYTLRRIEAALQRIENAQRRPTLM